MSMKLLQKCYLISVRRIRLTRTSLIYLNRETHNLGYDEKAPTQLKESNISTLFVPARYGGIIYQAVKPIIDVQYIEKHANLIDHSCRVRGIKLDLEYTLHVLKNWICKQEEHHKISSVIQEAQEEEKRLKSLDLIEEAEMEHRKWTELLQHVKVTKENLYDIEDIAMPLIAKIPNVVSTLTPTHQNSIQIQLEPDTKAFKTKSHVEIGTSLSLLEFSEIRPYMYYLKGPMAELAISAEVYFCEKLQGALFSPLSCVDFCKSFISEATGLNPHSYDHCIPVKVNKSSQESGQRLNLVGGASFESFCAYLTNMNVSTETLPFKYFCLGRHYESGNRLSLSPSLFSVVQSSRIQSIVLSEPSDGDVEFNKLFELVLLCYSPLKMPFRTVEVAAPGLNCTESRRKQLELWSPSLQQYIPVAYVSQRNDFVSKRLHITYGSQVTITGYCSIIESVIVDIPVLLGCLVENFTKTDEFLIADIFKLHAVSGGTEKPFI